jgi:hypothetical protein
MIDPPVPIFVISFDRADYLRRAIASYRAMNRPVDIVIHDNGSSESATLAALDEFERAGAQVYRGPAITTAEDLNRVDQTVRSYFDGRRPVPYVVTDCDIDLSEAPPEALDVYHELLDGFPAAECVGPMLRIADVPRSYPLFNWLMNRHVQQFWAREPQWTSTAFGEVAYLEANIDTTFALHRAGSTFRRFKRGLRIYEPYEARHLDWYEPGVVRGPYFEASAGISHWNGRLEHERHAADPLCVGHYTVVRTGSDGRLAAAVLRPLADNPP